MHPERYILLALVLVALLVLVACDDSDGGEDDTVDQGSDLVDQAADLPDVDDVSDTDLDTVDGEDAGDVEAEDMGIDFMPGPCPDPPTGPEPAAGRWSLSLFHFNVQYVAGGTEGFAEKAIKLDGLAEELDLTAEEVEDRIITESYVPLLDVLERNPDFAITTEMQGYMIDVMMERHPEQIERMRTLVDDGQLELVSIHWSDQFFLAFGREDMDESWERTQASFAAAGLPLSRVVFTQEGQFGEGFASWLKEKRPDAVMVMARNIQRFYQQSLENIPYWTVNDLDVVLPLNVDNDIVQLTWNFFDDGELLATGDLNPYAGTEFSRDARSILGYERKLECLVQNGFRVGRVSDYLDAVKDAGAVSQPMPPFLDSTWQPRSTRGPLRWMGGAGDIWPRHENDLEVLRTCIDARDHVLALKALVDDLGDAAPQSYRDGLDRAWRELLWGEVSDARGVNPWLGEVEYGLSHCGNARTAALTELEAERSARGVGALSIDTRDGSITELAGPPLPEPPVEVSAPIQLDIVEDRGAAPTITWYRATSGNNPDFPWWVEIEWPAVPDAVSEWDDCLAIPREPWGCRVDPPPMVIEFPRDPGLMAYRPALSNQIARYTEADFDLQDEAFSDAVWTTAADGLIELSPGQWLVKDTSSTQLAVGFPAGANRNQVVQIRDETRPPHEPVRWRFWYTERESVALELADRNLNPVVIVSP